MQFIVNTYDPNRPEAKLWFNPEHYARLDEEWREYLDWLADKVIGPPRATRLYTAAQLRETGMVGVYAEARGK